MDEEVAFVDMKSRVENLHLIEKDAVSIGLVLLSGKVDCKGDPFEKSHPVGKLYLQRTVLWPKRNVS